MSTAELIFEKSRTLPGDRQAEALRFVDFLIARGSSATEANEWRRLLRETQSLPGITDLSEADIDREVTAVRSGA